MFFVFYWGVFPLNPGWFLLSSSQHRNQNSVAQVLSEWIQPRETVCFSLWYHMKSRSEKIKKNRWVSEGSGGGGDAFVYPV